MKILVPMDGSAPALAALRHVLDLRARGLPLSVVLANVQTPAGLYELVTARDPDLLAAAAREAGAHALAAAEGLCEQAGCDYEGEVAQGDPAPMLAELAENYGCEAVVMGARGLGGPLSPHLGSVTTELLRDTTLPVTVVRHVEPESEAT
jgi:nucleotide-binding universal stress UspA family protein